MKWLFWKQPLDFSILYSELLTVAFYLEKICFKIQVCELQKYLVHSVILYLHCLIMLLCSNSSTTIFFLSTLMKKWAYSTINQSIDRSINWAINQRIEATHPTTESAGPGLPDTTLTFIAPCGWNFWIKFESVRFWL